MKVSIQRQCDGDYDAQDVHRCAAVLEVTFDIKDKATSEDWTKAWAAAGVVPKVFDAMWFASIREAREGIEVTELFAPDLYLVVRVQ